MKKELTRFRLMSFKKLFVCFFTFAFLSINAQEANIWKKYTGQLTGAAANGIPDLPNYTSAGYKIGDVEIPKATGTRFNVVDYGAVPNDDIADDVAIQAAIDAAEAAGGGVVFFSSGVFTVNTTTGNSEPIHIGASNIILKGSGSTHGGTIIHMKQPMAQTPGKTGVFVAAPPMFDFGNSWDPKANGAITEDVNRGDNFFTVASEATAQNFLRGKFLRLDMNSGDSAAGKQEYYTDGLAIPSWMNLSKWKSGIVAKEVHEIDHVDGKRVYIKGKFADDLKVSHLWKATVHGAIEECGFEDIHFATNNNTNLSHGSGGYVPHSGWNAVNMGYSLNSYVRRCRFTNTTKATSAGLSTQNTFYQMLIDGKRGHYLATAGWSSNILIGLIWDNVGISTHHGTDLSGFTSGSVVWRIEGSRGMDIHGSMPRTNLIDLYSSSGVTAHGGANQNFPHHLTGLTIWNQERKGGNVSNYNFWSGVRVAKPIIVGYHGTASTTFNQGALKYEESNGTKVIPESLYEAQLEHRLGTRPAWIDKVISEYNELKVAWYTDPVERGYDYTEPLTNVSFSNWGTGSHTSNSINSVNWTADGFAEYGRLNSGKNIRFAKGEEGFKSNTIPGGIGRFSVTCKDVFDTGVARKIQLFINGNLYDTFTHTGGGIYKFKVDNINQAGNFTMSIRNASDGSPASHIAIDNVSWTSYPNRVLSVEDEDVKSPSMQVYPNPASDRLHISGVLDNNSAIEIFDITGKTMIKTNLVNTEDSIDVSNLKTGLYFVKVQLSNGTSSILKFIKK